MYRRLALLAVGLALLCTTPLAAQDAALSQMYGSGVHAFFSQEYRQAYDYFTAAVDAGTPDPRCYYFRGLTYLQLGREEEAKMDFEEAARLEAEDINEFYRVGRALERVQGKVRLMVEQYRAEARLEAMRRAEELRKQRYGELREAEQRVLEAQAATAPATPPEVPAAPQPATIEDPFGVGPAQPPSAGPPAPAQPAPAMTEPAETPAPAAQEAPFSAVPAPAGTDQDPFATQPAQQPAAAEPAGAEVPPGTTGSGVLGAIGKAVGKAITEGEEETAAATDDPFGAAPAAAPSAEQPAMPDAAQPAAAEEDPFAPAPAGAQPAAATDDPFGAAPAAAPGGPAPAGAQSATLGAAGSPFMEEEEQPAAGAPAPAPASDDPFAQDPANP